MRRLQFDQDGETLDFLCTAMRKLDLFASLSDEQLRKMLYFVKLVEFDEGEVVFEKGASGDAFYVIWAGAVQAFVSGFFGGTKVLRTMGPGDFFGELALLLRQPRSASIGCVEATQCFVLDTGDFELLMERNPDIADVIKAAARERFNNPG